MRTLCLRNHLRVLLCAATVLTVSAVGFCQGATSPKESLASKVRSLDRPLTFEANRGQVNARAQFLSLGPGYELFLTPTESVISLARESGSANGQGKSHLEAAEALHLGLQGASQKAKIVGEDELAGKSNYYIGNDQSQWRTSIPNYSRVRYRSIYPGIDLVYYGNQRTLEHDFVVAPGADPRRIKLQLSGAKSTYIEANGDLAMDLGNGVVRLLKPVAYQEVNGKRQQVLARYELDKRSLAHFILGQYDKRRELVIDPKLSYSTYFGGSYADQVNSVAVKGSTVYVTGYTTSADFPATSGACINCGAFEDVFVAAFNVNGALVFSTYFGGHGTNEARAIALDSAGNAFVGGFTEANDMPASNSTKGGTFDGFLAKFSPSGTLASSIYFGGAAEDQVLGLTFDTTNSHVIATGYTTSTNFPAAAPVASTLPGQLYKTANGASTWNLSSGNSPNNLAGMDVLALLVVPGALAPTKVYAGGSMGVFTSSDGFTWSPMNAGFNHNKVTCLVNDPTTSGSLYACTDVGLFKFNPSAAQWSFVTNFTPGNIQLRALLVDSTTPTTLYAATNVGVYVYTAASGVWTASNNGLLNTDVYSLVQDAGGALYAGTSNDGSNPIFYESFGAASWFAPGSGLPTNPGNGFFSNSLTYDSISGNIYAGIQGSGGFVTSNGGFSWAALGSGLVQDALNVETFAIDPLVNTTIYVATDNGLFKSTDSGSTLVAASAPFTSTSVKALAVDAQASQTGGTVLYAGVDSKQGFVATFDSSLNQLTGTPFGGDGVGGRQGNPFSIFATQGGTHGNAVVSDNSGNFYVAGSTPSTLPNTQLGAQPSIVDLDDAFIMAFNSSGASLWSTYFGGSGNDYINSIAFSPSDSSIVVGGFTLSSDLNLFSPYQATCSTIGCGFLAKYTTSGTPTFSTYYGNSGLTSGANWVQSVGVNQTTGAIWGAGGIYGGSVPRLNPLPSVPYAVYEQGFVMEFPPSGASPLFSSDFGGSTNGTFVTSLSVDSTGAAYVAGSTYATDFPIAGSPLRSTIAGSNTADGFVMQLTDTGASNDLSISVTPTAPTPAAGVPTTFNITVTNNTSTGTGATGVRITTDLNLDAFTSPAGTCTSGLNAACNFGTLAPLASVTATATNTYAVAGNFTNFFYARTDDNDPNPANNVAQVTATVSPGTSDIAVALAASATAVAHDSDFTYTLTVTNLGPAGSDAFTIPVTLDASLILVGLDPNGYCYNDGGVFCRVSALGPGAQQQFVITVQAPSSLGSVTSSATASYINDTNSANNTGTATTSITPSADLSVYDSVYPYATVGAPFQVDVAITNNGPDAATNVRLYLKMPPQLTLVSSVNMSCSGPNSLLICTVGPIAAPIDTPVTVTPQFTVVANYPGVFTIQQTVSDTGSSDPYNSDNVYNLSLTASDTNGSEYYVVSNLATGDISAYSVGTTGTQYPLTARGPASPAINAVDITGRYVYVGSGGFSGYTSVVDTTVQREVMRIHGVAGRPMVTTPDGSRLITHVASFTTDALAVIDTSTFQVIKTISLDGLFGDQVGVQDLQPTSGVVANNKLYLQVGFIPNTGTANWTTAVIDLGTYAVSQVTGASTAAPNPSQQHSIAASADQTRVYALRHNPASILVIDTSNNSVIDTISLPLSNATSIVATRDPNDPNGNFAYVAGRTAVAPIQNEIVAVDLAQGTVVGAETVSFLPTNLALSADGNSLHGVRIGVIPTGNNAFFASTPDIRLNSQTLQEFNVGDAGGLSIGFLSSSVAQYAPTISTTVPATIDNSTANTVSILGSNFAPGARVRIGDQDTVTPTFVSTGRLDVSLPALVPENQENRIIVTLPNSQELPTRRNISGIAPFRLPITNPFQLPNSLLLLKSGESAVTIVDPTKNGVDIRTMPEPFSVAIAPDNQTFYTSSFNAGTGVQAVSLATGQPITTIPVPNDVVGYQDALATGTDPVDGKAVLYFTSGDASFTSDQLSIVDADSTSATFNQVKRVINTNDNNYGQSWALVASPSGRYVYSVVDAYNNTTGAFLGENLIAYDTKTSTFGKISNIGTAFNAEEAPNHLRITPDGSHLILPAADGSIIVLDISSDPLLSTYGVSTIFGFGHSYKTFQVVGSRLFAFDANTNTIAAFNFLPATSNFSILGSVTLPGSGSFYEAPLLVEPTGTYIYVGLKDQDILSILDANKVAASDPTALLDQGGDVLGLEAILIATPVSPQVDLASAFTGLYSFPGGGAGYFYATVTNLSVNPATNVMATVTMPAGVLATSASYSTTNNQFGVCTTGATPTCTIPTLSGNEIAYLTVNFTVPSTPGIINFTLNATSTEPDSNPQDNLVNGSMTVVAGADISVTANFPGSPLTAGQAVNYNFTVNNAGPSTATTVYVDVFGLDNQVITPPQGVSCSSNTLCTIGSLAVSSPQVFSVSGNVSPLTSTTSLSVSVSPISPGDPDYNNNYASANLSVISNGILPDHFLLTDRVRGQGYGITPSPLGGIPNGSGRVGVTPNQVVPLPGGRIAFIMNFQANYVSVFDMTVGQEIYRIQNEPGRVAALSSDASQIFIANNYNPGMIDVFDTSTFALVKHIPIANEVTGGNNISNMCVVGSNLYLMTSGAGSLGVVNLNTNALSFIGAVTTYGNVRSTRLVATPDGSTVVALGGGDVNHLSTLFLINTATNIMSQAITLPINTTTMSLAMTPVTGGNIYAYVTTDTTLRVLDLTSGSPTYGQLLGTVVTVPFAPHSSVITSDGATIGFVVSALNQSPNIASIAVSLIPQQPPVTSFATSTLTDWPGVLADAPTDFLPPSTAPQISQISPPGLVNSSSQTLQITGTGFSSDALVKVGTGNPIVPSSVTPTQITVTVPAFVESGLLNVEVIDQNLAQPLASRNQTSPASPFYVIDAPTFNSQYDIYAADYGDSTIVSNGSKGSVTGTTQVSQPTGVAVTTGDIWYVASFNDGSLESSYGGEGTTRIPLSGGTAYGDSLAVVPDPTTGRTVALAPSFYSPSAGTYDWQLNVVDVDPYSPTINTIIRTIPANATNVGFGVNFIAAFAARPDGKYAFQIVELNDGTADLVIYNVSTGAATIIPTTSLGIDSFIQGMQVSPDSQYLAIADIFSNNVKVFSLANPVSPSLKGTIPISNPNNVALTDCCNLRIVGNKLFAFDPGTMMLEQFNFIPATPDFSAQGALQLPGHLDPTFQGGLGVSPDGAYVYAAEMDDDAIDVIDATKISTNSIAQALLTRFSAQGTAPVSIAVNPVPTFSATADLAVTVSHTPEPVSIGSNITYTIAVTNYGPSASGAVVLTDALQAGMSFVSATATPNSVTCVGTTAVSCSLGALSPNTSTVVTLVASASTPVSGPPSSTIQVGQVSNPVPDPNPANNVATDTATIGLPALTVTVTPDNLSPSINGTVNYTVTIQNTGVVAATNVVATLTQDSGGLALPNGSYPNCTHDFNNPLQNLVCTYTSIAPGTSVSFVEAASMPSVAGAVNLTTTVIWTENPAGTTQVTTIAVGGGADVSVSAGGPPVAVGGIPIYTVTLTNNGPNQATGVVLTDVLDRFGFVSATTTAGTCNFDGVNVVCNVGTMAVNAVVTVNVGVSPPATGWASHQFYASSASFDPDGGNNSANMGPFGGTIGNTKAGANVLVDAHDAATGIAANFLFSSIAKPGLTTITSAAGTQAPSGYRFGNPALVYDLSTTASYTGNIRVTLQIGAVAFHHPAKVRLFHLENGAWVDRTSSVDAVHGLITGTTASLSPFIAVEPLNNVPVANAGSDQTLPGLGANGSVVTLNGAASTDADNDTLTYKWTGPFPEGNGTVTGVKPSVTLPLGASKVTLVVNDGEADSAAAQLNVTVSDFLVAPPAQVGVARGSSASFNVALTPKFGSFDAPVTLACSNLPAGVTCSILSDTATPGAQGATVNVTLTASPSARLRPNGTSFLAFWLGGVPLLGLLWSGKLKRSHRFAWILLAIVLLALLVGMVGCGGGGGSSAGLSGTHSTTATITLTGTSAGLQHSSNVTVVIQ